MRFFDLTLLFTHVVFLLMTNHAPVAHHSTNQTLYRRSRHLCVVDRLPLQSIINQFSPIIVVPLPNMFCNWMSITSERLASYRHHLEFKNMAAANNFFSIVAGVGAGTGQYWQSFNSECNTHVSQDAPYVFPSSAALYWAIGSSTTRTRGFLNSFYCSYIAGNPIEWS